MAAPPRDQNDTKEIEFVDDPVLEAELRAAIARFDAGEQGVDGEAFAAELRARVEALWAARRIG